MALADWATLSSQSSGHALRTFGYEIQTSFDGGSTWESDVVSELETIRYHYGSQNGYAQFKLWDRDTITVRSGQSKPPAAKMPTPLNNMRVQIYVSDGGSADLVFYGIVNNIHETRTDEGTVFTCRAKSYIAVLDELHITAAFNKKNDTLNPQPVFSAGTGSLTENRLFTVYEIINEILAFDDAWDTDQIFTTSDVDWNGLDTDPRLGRFVPNEINFDNTPKGQAITEVLQRAGNFHMWYDHANHRIRIVELNLACNRVGSEWDIVFPNLEDLGGDFSFNYAHSFQIKHDNTDWSTTDSANVVRVTGAPIRFYSGNYFIPEQVTGDHAAQIENDTVANQQARAINLDNCQYRFNSERSDDPVKDYRKRQNVVVGAPLFPDWNIYEDWWPEVVELLHVVLPDGVNVQITDRFAALAKTEADYVTDPPQIEFEPTTRGYEDALGKLSILRTDHLKAYQAWHAPDTCPACQGSGLVSSVYTNSANEPEFEVVTNRGPDGRNRRSVRVTNWRFNPSRFGESNPTLQSYGLSPWSTSPDQPYPIPWKNMCPVCRGVGRQPEYKIRNINGDLVEARTSHLLNASQADEILIDPENTATSTETWQDAQTRATVQESPLVQVESSFDRRPLPKYEHRNKEFKDINELDRKDANGKITVESDEQTHYYPHPLGYEDNHKLLYNQAGYAATDPESRLIPDNWTAKAVFTTVETSSPVPYRIDYKLGRVLFEDPVFIRCLCEVEHISREGERQTKLRVGPDGWLKTTGRPDAKNNKTQRRGVTMNVNNFPNGFWRMPRVWMQFFYTRPGYHRTLDTELDGTTSIPVSTVQGLDPEGNTQDYLVRAMINDGRFAIEVVKENPDVYGPSAEVGNTDRVQQVAINYERAQLEITEEDLDKMVVPPHSDMTQLVSDAQLVAAITAATNLSSGEASTIVSNMSLFEKQDMALEVYKRDTKDYDFPRARLMKWEGVSAAETVWQAEGYTQEDFEASLVRPRRLSWRLRDDRQRMLQVAIQTLETSNNIRVSGTMELVGQKGALTEGMGWIDYPDRACATVVGVEYSFRNGFTTTLELSREQPRYSELPEDQREALKGVVKTINALVRDQEYQKSIERNHRAGASQRQRRGGRGPQAPGTW